MSENSTSNIKDKKKVVVIGGGTGIYPVLQGLKKHHEQVDITAVIAMADSGGSTGRLRDEFGQLPVGDMRMALTALASEVDDHDQLLRELFLHRFDKGEGLSGHNFGNLLMVALTEIIGSEAEAVKAASRILRVRGRVLPVTADKVHLVAKYSDGQIVVGEHAIDEPAEDRFEHSIENISMEPKAVVSEEVKEAIANADLIVLGPGDLYTSLLSNCIVGGVGEAICESKAEFVFAVNLMTKPGQTHGLTALGHAKEIEKYVGKFPDVLVINTSVVPDDLLKRYQENFQFPVVDDCHDAVAKVLRADLLSEDEVVVRNGDVLKRSLVRGDGDKFAAVILGLLG